MRILIVDQCCSAKKTTQRTKSLSKETIDASTREQLIQQEGVESYRAAELYQGRQQTRIKDAIQTLESAGDEVQRVFVSAGFGVVEASESLPSYDITFADMNVEEISNRASKLQIYTDLRECIQQTEYDMIYFALGTDYYRSIQLEKLLDDITGEPYVVLFNQEEFDNKAQNIISIPARTPQARQFGTTVIALKGEYLSNFAAHRAQGDVVESLTDIEDYCQSKVGSQSGLDDY